MRFLILITILSCLSNSLFSQTAKIVGFVRDDKGNLIVGASVIYRKDITFGASTNEKGFYELTIPSGLCRIVVRYTGMISDTVSIEISENEVKNVDFTLNSYIKEFQQVDVKVGKFDKPIQEQTVTMLVLKPEMIENKNTRSIESALDQTPGLKLEEEVDLHLELAQRFQ
jgi:hypothetical protein